MDKYGPPQGMQSVPPSFAPPPPYSDGHKAPPIQRATGGQIILIQQTAYGPDTQPMTCPYCQSSISTRVLNETGSKTHLFALLLCLFGCVPCAPCVYCVDSCLVKKHYCPTCNAFLGMYNN